MHKGIYIALSAATLKQAQMDIISQNLANVNTTGYKKDKISFNEFLVSQMNNRYEEPDGRTMSHYGTVNTDMTPGSMVNTGNPLDLAIDGDGFFSLEGGRYSKRGDFRLDGDGYIVNHKGIKVLGQGGPIQITDTGAISISGEGEVSVNSAGLSNIIDTLKVIEFPDTSVLRKSGEDMFEAAQEGTESKAVIQQGYLEKSNVDVVREMVQMITALREFETYQKAIQMFDESTGRVLTDIPRI